MSIKEQWEDYFNAPFPKYLHYTVGREEVMISDAKLEGFIKQCKEDEKDWREINIYTGLVSALIRAYKWCLDNDRHEFSRSDIKHLILRNENDTARWGDWILFGNGMVYKPEGKGSWGLNMERVQEFLEGKREIPIKVAKRGKEFKVLEIGTIKNIKNLSDYLDGDMKYMVKYLNSSLF